MMIKTLILVAAGLLSTPSTSSLVGKVRVRGGGPRATAHLVAKTTEVRLQGSMLGELIRLQAAQVEVLGERQKQSFVVKAYRILDVGGGRKPLVGEVAETTQGLALRDGEGEAIPLSLPPRSKARLMAAVGAKIWIYGKRLVSGELKVLRYGVLKDAPPASIAESEAEQ